MSTTTETGPQPTADPGDQSTPVTGPETAGAGPANTETTGAAGTEQRTRHLASVPDTTATDPDPIVGGDGGVGSEVGGQAADAAAGEATGDTARPHLARRIDAAIGRAVARFEGTARPDVVRTDRPSLAKVWRHARHGRYTAGAGPLRWLGIAWAVLAVTVIAVLYGAAWCVERPARGAVALAVTAAVVATPPGRWVATVLLWPAYHLILLCTNLP